MTYEEIIVTPYEVLAALSEDKIDAVVDTVLQHYRKVGYPYFPKDTIKMLKEYKTLHSMDSSKFELPNNEVQQGMCGLATCNSFHPEMPHTRCRSAKSPMDIFMDDTLFKTAIKKRIKYNDRLLNDSCIRRTLTAFGGQAVSNFRPTVAKWVYDKYCPVGGYVLDPCMGYGGRLFGALSTQITSYTGVDPNNDVCKNNMHLYWELSRHVENLPDVLVHNEPFEDFIPCRSYDLIFTSPPYFNIEKYAMDDTQSYVRYPEYSLWVDKFLRVLIQNSYEFLKPSGYLVLNVGHPIDKDTLTLGSEVFKSTPEIYNMRLSRLLGKGDKSQVSHKTEPIFVWRKQ